MRKTWIFSVVAVLACFTLGWVNSQRVRRELHLGPVKVATHVQWASSAGTVNQQFKEADAIVGGRILKTFSPRIHETRLSGEPEDRRFPQKFDVMAFTEALLQVTHVYAGEVPKRIRILQTGGLVPENDHHSELLLEVIDDPLLLKGKEHIFFLQEITGDPILAPNRKLYRIVNSAGRYDVDVDKVTSHSTLAGQRPTSLRKLRQQIKAASTR